MRLDLNLSSIQLTKQLRICHNLIYEFTSLFSLVGRFILLFHLVIFRLGMKNSIFASCEKE